MEHKILNDEAVSICSKALETYGPAIQKVVAMEECGELIQAISKSLRDKDHNVEEEIADTEIMCMQMRLVYDNKKVDQIKQEKLKRLRGLVW